MHILLGSMLVGALTLATASHAQGSREVARKDLREFAKTSFQSSSDHCETFSAVVEKAASSASSVGDMLEDLRLVLIGEDWLRRSGKRGNLYFGVRTGSSGFKSELRDSSPQVEHAMAAIYLAKTLPPGGVSAKGSFIEFLTAVGRGEAPNAADMLLYAYGEDLGGRLAANNIKQFPVALRRTLCD